LAYRRRANKSLAGASCEDEIDRLQAQLGAGMLNDSVSQQFGCEGVWSARYGGE